VSVVLPEFAIFKSNDGPMRRTLFAATVLALCLIGILPLFVGQALSQNAVVQNNQGQSESVVVQKTDAPDLKVPAANQPDSKNSDPKNSGAKTAPTKPSESKADEAQAEPGEQGEDLALFGGIDPKEVFSGPTLVFDAKTGEVLSEKRAGESWYPASTTKLLTAYIVFEKIRSGQMTMDQKLTVTKLAARQPASRIGLPWGDTISTDLALQALLVYSANDMAYVLAENASGSAARFAVEMNATAQKLGMTASHFVNPNGLHDPRQFTTARDMGLLARAIIQEFPEHARFFAQPHVAIGRRKLPNRNMLIRVMKEADGMKTGFVCDSGYNLVASATRDGRHLVTVVFGTKSGFARAALAKDMLEQGFVTTALPKPPLLSEIVNVPQATTVPFDMTPLVCKKKEVAEVVDPVQVFGWGISLGQRATARDSDAVLVSQLMTPAGLGAPGFPANYPALDKTGILPIVYGMSQGAAVETCEKFKTAGTACSVIPEGLFNLYSRIHLKAVENRKTERKDAKQAQKPQATAEGDSDTKKQRNKSQARRGKAQTKQAKSRKPSKVKVKIAPGLQ
jgi:D-alanyl-D-alanine carboxypeptidase